MGVRAGNRLGGRSSGEKRGDENQNKKKKKNDRGTRLKSRLVTRTVVWTPRASRRAQAVPGAGFNENAALGLGPNRRSSSWPVERNGKFKSSSTIMYRLDIICY